MGHEPRIRSHLKHGETYSASAKQLVDGVLGLLGYEADMMAVFEVWDREISSLVKGCEAMAIQGTRLIVKVPSVVHRHELSYAKKRILDRVNQAMGRKAIIDIQFELDMQKGGDLSDQSKARKRYWNY